MELDVQEGPPSARRILADLPPELKATIARMTRDQDLAYQRRIFPTMRRMEALGLSSRVCDGKSAQALSLVDRAWHSATITAKDCSKNIFGFRIARNYGRFVKRVYFDWTPESQNDEEDWSSLLRALPFFPNLEHITLTDEAAVSLFAPGEDQSTFKESLQIVAPSISSLCIHLEDPDPFLWIMPLFVNLRRLEMILGHEGNSFPLFQMTRKYSALQHLNLRCSRKELLVPFNSAGAGASSWPGLRSLELTFDEDMGVDSWSFIQSLSTTLETVSLVVNERLTDELIADSSSTTRAFPNLRRLALHAEHSNTVIPSLLQLFSASPVRHLVLSVLSLDSYDLADSPPILLTSILRLCSTELQTVHMDYQVIPTIREAHHLRTTLRTLASVRNVSLTLTAAYDAYDVYFHRRIILFGADIDIPPPIDFDDNCDESQRLLQYGLRRVEGLRGSRDGVAVDRLREALMPLKAHMLRDMD